MQHINFRGEKTLLRVDFNVPLDKNHIITDDTRMRGALSTIRYILDRGGSVIILSHLGRPQKKKMADGNIDVETFTLRHLVKHLASLLNRPVKFASDTIGPEAKSQVAKLKSGEILLLENTRFNTGETKGDETFARELAGLGENYINDAFGTAHRAHASTAIVAQFFKPQNKGIGFLMEREIKNADLLLTRDERPYTAIFGGAKVSDKILLIEKFLDVANHILIGGGMSYTFFKAMGGQIGTSLCEMDKLDNAEFLLKLAKKKGVGLHLPQDSIVADSFTANANTSIKQSDCIPEDWMGLDIGPTSRAAYSKIVESSKTIIWNGPMGVFEMEQFAEGTYSIAQAVVTATENGAYSLVGGGDSVAALAKMGFEDKISFVSTGGGAMMEYLEGKDLPGIIAINAT